MNKKKKLRHFKSIKLFSENYGKLNFNLKRLQTDNHYKVPHRINNSIAMLGNCYFLFETLTVFVYIPYDYTCV